MHVGRTVFSQLMDFVPRQEFRSIVHRHRGEHRIKSFSCWDQFLCMAFAQLTAREGLRDIESCLRSFERELYHCGFRSKISRSTLADANEKRPWQIFEDLALLLIAHARRLYQGDRFLEEIDNAVYAFDSSIIELCLQLYPWARAANHLKTAAGIKLHTLLDVQADLPVFARVSVANLGDVRMLDELFFEAGAFYVLDRGYMDFARLWNIHRAGAFFVIRAKHGLRFRRIDSQIVDRATGVQVDQVIHLKVPRSLDGYPDRLRRIKFYDATEQRTFVYPTNNELIEARLIADLYKSRWQIELFFKWIKQHLRIKAFFGRSPNAVKTQIWIAISIFVLVAILKKELRLDHSLNTILQILSVSLFVKEPIYQRLTATPCLNHDPSSTKQLYLFNS
jgi:hypothetical protein